MLWMVLGESFLIASLRTWTTQVVVKMSVLWMPYNEFFEMDNCLDEKDNSNF